MVHAHLLRVSILLTFLATLGACGSESGSMESPHATAGGKADGVEDVSCSAEAPCSEGTFCGPTHTCLPDTQTITLDWVLGVAVCPAELDTFCGEYQLPPSNQPTTHTVELGCSGLFACVGTFADEFTAEGVTFVVD